MSTTKNITGEEQKKSKRSQTSYTDQVLKYVAKIRVGASNKEADSRPSTSSQPKTLALAPSPSWYPLMGLCEIGNVTSSFPKLSVPDGDRNGTGPTSKAEAGISMLVPTHQDQLVSFVLSLAIIIVLLQLLKQTSKKMSSNPNIPKVERGILLVTWLSIVEAAGIA